MNNTTLQITNIYKSSISLALPMMIQNGITNAVGLVDNLMVGSLGTESISAVSIVTQLFFVYSLAVFGGLSGPGIYCAQYYGSQGEEGLRAVFRLKIWIIIFCLILGGVAFLFFGDNLILLYLHGESGDIDPVETFNIAKKYLSIMLLGLIPFSVSQLYGTHLKETGDSVKPMIAGVVGVFCDIVFNYVLIFGKFGAPKLGVAGAAIATVISRVVEMFILIIWSHKKIHIHTFLEDVYSSLLVPSIISKPVVQKGLPIFINEFLWAAGLAVLTQCYSLRGLDIVAGLNISNTICNLLNVAFVAYGSAVGILLGQMLGAGEGEQAQKASLKLTGFSLIISLVFAIIMISLSGVFPLAYNTSHQVREFAKYFIILTACFFPVQSALNSLYFTLRCGGKTTITFLFDSGFSWVITIPLAYILCLKTSLSIITIYAIIQAIDIIKVTVGYVLVKKGIWITNLVDGTD